MPLLIHILVGFVIYLIFGLVIGPLFGTPSHMSYKNVAYRLGIMLVEFVVVPLFIVLGGIYSYIAIACAGFIMGAYGRCMGTLIREKETR